MIRFGISITPGFVDEEEDLSRQGIVICGNNASFTAGHMFSLLEAEAADVSNSTNHFPLVTGQEGLGRILNHRNVFFGGQLQDISHVTGIAKEMSHDDSSSFLT